MEFSEILEALDAKLQEDEEWGALRPEIESQYGSLSQRCEGADARINEYSSMNEENIKAIQDLKARNYDLLMKVPADAEIEGDGVVEEHVNDNGELYHIDNLFVDKEPNQPNKEG